MNVDQYTPEILSDTIYLHVKPKALYSGGSAIRSVVVTKAVKSLDAQVEPGVYIVKLKVQFPKRFFQDAMPAAVVQFEPGDEISFEAVPEENDPEFISLEREE